MKKRLLAGVLLACVAAGALFAVDGAASIDTDILATAKREKYTEDFSYVAPKNYSTGKQIRDMGRRLGAEVKYQAEVNKSPYPFSSGQPDYKYKASRVFPGKKAGADVIYIGRLSKVCTFKNLNRVISGYIERAYGVSMEQADQISLKVCYWNTNHYNDRAYFVKNFEHRVVEVFENRTKSIGLARSYKNWHPARIVIPFVLVAEAAPQAVEPKLPEPEPDPEPVAAFEPDPEPVLVPSRSEEPVRAAPVYEFDEPQQSKGFFRDNLLLIIIGAAMLLVLVIVAVLKAHQNFKDE